MSQVQILLIVVLVGIIWGQNCPCDWGNKCGYDAIPMKGCQEDKKRRDLKAMGWDVDFIDNEEYPYMVSLQTLKCGYHELGTGCYEHFCGGTMIAPNLVLTLAACLDRLKRSKPSQTLNGQQYYTSRIPIYAAISPQCRHLSNEEYGRFQVNKIFIHPEYQEDIDPASDVAILEIFREEGQYYEGPLVEIITEDMAEDVSEAFVLGYGDAYPEHRGRYIAYPLHGAYLTLISENICKEFLALQQREITFSGSASGLLNYTNMMCYYNTTAEVCDGDAGGPLLYNQSIQIGLVSWGIGNSCQNIDAIQMPTVYTRLSFFADWIEQIITDYGA